MVGIILSILVLSTFFYPLLGSISMLAKYNLNFWVYIFVIWSGLKNRHKIIGMDHMIFVIKSSQKDKLVWH